MYLMASWAMVSYLNHTMAEESCLADFFANLPPGVSGGNTAICSSEKYTVCLICREKKVSTRCLCFLSSHY
jgi:hypothetical protein